MTFTTPWQSSPSHPPRPHSLSQPPGAFNAQLWYSETDDKRSPRTRWWRWRRLVTAAAAAAAAAGGVEWVGHVTQLHVNSRSTALYCLQSCLQLLFEPRMQPHLSSNIPTILQSFSACYTALHSPQVYSRQSSNCFFWYIGHVICW